MAIEARGTATTRPRALADDIEHWLADEPVKAYPEERLERLGRWLRQHRTWTYAAVAALLGISVAATIGVVVVDRARRREAIVRKEAETNFNMALKAVDDYLTSVSENTLFKTPGFRRYSQTPTGAAQFGAHVLQGLRESSGAMIPCSADNWRMPTSESEKSRREVESPNQAIAAYHQAQAIWEPLVAAHPDDQELQGRIWLNRTWPSPSCRTRSATSILRAPRSRSLEHVRSWSRSRRPIRSRADYQSRLADCYSEIAIVQARLEQSSESLVLLEKAKAIEQGLINRYPDKHAYQKTLAEITNVLGLRVLQTGQQ